MRLCICGLNFTAIQLNKTGKCKGRSFLWKDDICPYVEAMILKIRNTLIFPLLSAQAR